MAHLIDLKSYADQRGVLTVIDRVLPFEVKRIYYIQDVKQLETRGGHSHYEATEGIICIKGHFTVGIQSIYGKQTFVLNDPNKCLIVEPGEYHEMYDFGPDSLLMAMSSTHYNIEDYCYTPLRYDDPLRESQVIK